MSNAKLFGIFCDDIRQEISGKVSLIGCYSSVMYTFEMPTKLPKLCVHFELQVDNSHKGKSAEIAVSHDGLVAGSVTIAIDPNLEADESGTISVNGGFELPFMEVSEPGKLSLYANIGDETLSGPTLGVQLHKEHQTGTATF